LKAIGKETSVANAQTAPAEWETIGPDLLPDSAIELLALLLLDLCERESAEDAA
jgi:hypothetical protein